MSDVERRPPFNPLLHTKQSEERTLRKHYQRSSRSRSRSISPPTLPRRRTSINRQGSMGLPPPPTIDGLIRRETSPSALKRRASTEIQEREFSLFPAAMHNLIRRGEKLPSRFRRRASTNIRFRFWIDRWLETQHKRKASIDSLKRQKEISPPEFTRRAYTKLERLERRRDISPPEFQRRVSINSGGLPLPPEFKTSSSINSLERREMLWPTVRKDNPAKSRKTAKGPQSIPKRSIYVEISEGGEVAKRVMDFFRRRGRAGKKKV